MHELFSKVLLSKDLSAAGELFSLADEHVLSDVASVLLQVQAIITRSDFLENHRDQSLVEICITRITSAIRETSSIELHASLLVDLLRTCLCYNLRPKQNGLEQPPHAKIASDVMACIFLNYSRAKVMRVALPVSVKFLHKGNRDICRNMSSYLSLAAIEHASLLAEHIQPILDSVISGNYVLARILPTIYGVIRDPIDAHVMTLVSILPECEDTEKLALLALFAQVAKSNAKLLEACVPQLCESLAQNATSSATLQVFYNVASSRPHILVEHTKKIREAVEICPAATLTAVHILCAVAKIDKERAKDILGFMTSLMSRLESDRHAGLLKELVGLCHVYPELVTAALLDKLARVEESKAVLARGHVLELRAIYAKTNNNTMTKHALNKGKSEEQQTTLVPCARSSWGPDAVLGANLIREQHQVAPARLSLATQNRSMTTLNAPNHHPSGLSHTKQDVQKSTISRPKASSQQSVMSRHSSNNTVMPVRNASIKPSTTTTTTTCSRSITCIAGSNRMSAHNSSRGLGASSPTKSISSGSMSGATGLGQKEVLTVNVSQINADLIRQVSNVLSTHDIDALPPPPTQMTTVQVSNTRTTNMGAPTYSNPGLAPFSLPTEPKMVSPKMDMHALTAADVYRPRQASTLPNRGRARRNNEKNDQNSQNRMSVFEPYPMRDTVQHFCEKHLQKIKTYMASVAVKLPLPVKCTIEERKGRKHARLHFGCQGRSASHCLYRSTLYSLKTRHARSWIHLMFLALQARNENAISSRESSVSALKHCWEILKSEPISFVTLVTGAFPHAKEHDMLAHELSSQRFFDVFEYNAVQGHWGCFLCNHPERADTFVQEREPVIEGHLKEKKGGKFSLFKKWRSRYFTLAGAKLSFKETTGDGGSGVGVTQILDVGSIKSVKAAKTSGRRKAFEIFTDDQKTLVLKAKDGSDAQQWMQALSVARAHSQARENCMRRLAYGGSVPRLSHHQRQVQHQHQHQHQVQHEVQPRHEVQHLASHVQGVPNSYVQYLDLKTTV